MITVDFDGYQIRYVTRKLPKRGWRFDLAILPPDGIRRASERWSGNAPTREDAEKRAFDSAKEWIHANH